MSTVFLHVGQCGNQLGQAFWEEASTSKWASAAAAHSSQGNRPKIRSTATHAPSSNKVLPPTTEGKVPAAGANWPTSTKIPPKSVPGKVPLTTAPAATKGRARPSVPMALIDGSIPCVMVDAEPKVIRQCLDKKRGGSGVLIRGVSKESCVWDRAGRGNNWACGYQHHSSSSGGHNHGTGRSEDLLERVLDSVRKVVERCDRFNGFVMFHSIAGGTGSGLGSALLEALRSDYPLPYMVTATVAPFGSGETPLQHLNSLLCLSWLQSYADAVLLFGNDSVLEQAQKYLARSVGAGAGGGGGRVGGAASGGGKGVSMEEMNGHISSVLCNALMPIWSAKQKTPNLAFQQPWETIRSLCPDPSTKFITTNHVLFTKPGLSWNQATSHLLHHSNPWTRQAAVKQHTTSLAFILRGHASSLEPFVEQGLGPLEAKLKKAYNTVGWNPFPVDYWMSFEPSIGQTVKLGTVLANSSVVLGYMGEVWERASVMFREKAYLHWYERYGCERETFQQAFESVQGVMDIYRDTGTQLE